MDKDINPYMQSLRISAAKQNLGKRNASLDPDYKILIKKPDKPLKPMSVDELWLGLDESAELYAFSLAIAPDVAFITGKKLDFDQILDNLAAMYFGIAIKDLTQESKALAIVSYDRFVGIFKETYVGVRADPESWY